MPGGFWEAFWPGLAATGVGTFVGAFLGVVGSRWILWLSERHNSREAQQQTSIAMGVLLIAVAKNRHALHALAEIYGRGQWAYDAYLDTATWDTMRSQIGPNLHNPELLGHLATFFDELEIFQQMSRLHTSLSVGLATTLDNVVAPRTRLGKNLFARTTLLLAAADQLIAELEAAGAKKTALGDAWQKYISSSTVVAQ
jgi:hypothetical protein